MTTPCTCGLPFGSAGPHADACATRQGITYHAVLPVNPTDRPGPDDLARVLGLPSVQALADQIQINGRPVNRRTLYKWEKRGAPFFTLAALRAWLLNHGLPVALPAPTLAEQLNVIQQPAQTTPNNPAGAQSSSADRPTTNPDGTALSASQLAALATRDVRALQADKLEIELAQLRRELFHRDVGVALIKDLAHDVLTGLTDLVPRFLRALTDKGLGGDDRPAIRECLQQTITELRESLTTTTVRHVTEKFGNGQEGKA